MTMLDRYVGRIVLGAFLAALTFFMFLLVLADLLARISKYADRAEELGISGLELAMLLVPYYLKLLPVLFTTVTPFATVIACMFAVSRLQHANEIVPMLFVGRSIHRVLRPMLALGVVAALAMAACWEWVVPQFGASLATTEKFLRKGDDVERFLVHEVHLTENQHFYAREFNPLNRTLAGVHLLVQGALAEDVSLTTATTASWDEQRLDWRLVDGKLGRKREESPQEWLGRPDLTPEVLVQQSRDTIDPEMLSYSELARMMVTRANRPDVRFAFHHHITYPLANVLLLLLVLPFAIHYERGGRIGRVLIAIGLCAGYLFLDLTCQSLGQRSFFHPVVMAWVPTIVLGSFGIVLFTGTRT